MSIRSIQKEPRRLLDRLRRRKRGLTLLEVAGALGIVAVAGVGFAQMAADSQLATKDKATAVRLKEVTDAATAYVRSNYPQIVAVAPLNAPIQIGIVAGETSAGGLQDLQTAGFLGSNFQNRNAYNQQHAVQVIKRPPAVAGGPERLDVLVNTFGGNAISDRSLPRVATLVGAEGGYIPEAAAAYSAAGTVQGNIIGAYGGWRVPTADYAGAGATAPSTGHVAATLGFDGTSILADFLYRFPVPGMPEANRMHADIDMTAHSINNLQRITGSGGGNSIDLSNAGRVSIQDDLSVNRDTSTGRDLSVGRSATVTGTGMAGSPSLTVQQGDLKVSQGSMDIAQDALIGRDSTVGRDLVVNGQVYSDVFASLSGANYAVSPTTTTTVATLNPEFLNADTLIYGSVVGKSITTPNPNSQQVANTVAGMSFEDGQKYIKTLSTQYNAEVRARAGTAGTAVRLGELLPRYVARGLYVVSSTGEVRAYVNGTLTTVGGGGRVPFPIYKDANTGAENYGCGIGEPQIYLSKMDDSYSVNLANAGAGGTSLIGHTSAQLPVTGTAYFCDSVGGCSNATVNGITTQQAITELRPGTINVASNATVATGADGWGVTFGGTPSGLDANGNQIARVVLAQTFCHFQFSEGGTYAVSEGGLNR